MTRTCGKYYKASTSINYDSRVVLTSKLLKGIYDSRLVNYDHRGFIRLATAWCWLWRGSKSPTGDLNKSHFLGWALKRISSWSEEKQNCVDLWSRNQISYFKKKRRSLEKQVWVKYWATLTTALNVAEDSGNLGQWLWLSWQSVCFQYQRSEVRN